MLEWNIDSIFCYNLFSNLWFVIQFKLRSTGPTGSFLEMTQKAPKDSETTFKDLSFDTDYNWSIYFTGFCTLCFVSSY